MNDDANDSPATQTQAAPPAPTRTEQTIGSSTIYRLCEEMIALREMNNRQHKLFEQTLTRMRDNLQTTFNSFAGDTQRAYQQLRQEIHGEKRVSLALFNELLDICLELEQIAGAKPAPDNAKVVARWSESIDVEARKVQDALRKHGIVPYDAVIASPYNPALHERVGSMRKEGMGPLLVAEQKERGYASQQPELVLRRPKVIVSE